MKKKRRSNQFMRFLKYILFLVVLCPIASLSALDPEKKVHQYHVSSWESEDGLPQNTVYSIVQSKEGYLWLGTMEGLVRFDGKNFSVFDRSSLKGLKENWVWSLMEDRQGRLWIGTYSGGLYLMENGKITDLEEFKPRRISALFEDSLGRIWIGTLDDGLHLYRDGSFSKVKTGKRNLPVTAVVELNAGFLIFGTEHGQLFSYRGSSFHQYIPKYASELGSIRAIVKDGGDRLYVGGNNGLLLLEREKMPRFLTNQLPARRVMTLKRDSRGQIWIGTYGGGLSRYKNGKMETIAIPDGLRGNIVISLSEDKEENLWVGTLGGGLSRVKDAPFSIIGKRDGIKGDIVLALFEDRSGKIWAGTDGSAVYSIEDGRATAFNPAGFPKNPTLFSVAEDNSGGIYFSLQDRGIFRFRDGKLDQVGQPILKNRTNVLVMHRTPSGDLWMGTVNRGLYSLKVGRYQHFSKETGLSSNMILSLASDSKGGLWIGTQDRGIDLLSKEGVRNFGRKEGLSGGEISALYIDKQDFVWAGTFGRGLNLIRNGKATVFTRENGLFDDNIYVILEDNNEKLWMSGNRGVWWVRKSDLLELADGKRTRVQSVNYGTLQGLRNVECNGGFQPAGVKASDGKLYFPTIRGVAVVDPSKLYENSIAPVVHIEKVSVDRTPVEIEKNIEFPADMKRLEITFRGLSFSDPAGVRFRYRLEGFDRDWIDASHDQHAVYTNLPAGSYTFRLKAANGDGVWTKDDLKLSFSRKRHFYQEPAVIGIFVLSAILLVIIFIRIGTGMVKKRNRELELMIAQKARDLADALNEVQGLSEELDVVNQELKEKYETYRMDEDTASELMKSLKKYMEEEKPYRNPGLSLKEVAQAIDLSPHYLSQLINSYFNMNFYAFINGYRIEEAKHLLTDPERDDDNIITIAYDSGFNAKTTFNSVFKKYTGLTPTQYRNREKSRTS